MLIPENDHGWIHRNYVCLLVKETSWALSHHHIFCSFLNFPPDCYHRNGDKRSRVCYKVYGVDKLTNNWNLYKKESTHPKSTLYVPRFKNMVAQILWWLVIIFVSESFVTRSFELRNIQYSSKSRSVSVLDEEGLIVVWQCWASARPAFQSNVAVYGDGRWSRITTCLFWIVYFHNGQ